MARITVEDCLKKENNRFSLVILAAKRTKQLLNGAKPLTEAKSNKAVVTSLREIADGQVRFLTEDEAREIAERGESFDNVISEESFLGSQVAVPKTNAASSDGNSNDDDSEDQNGLGIL